MANELKPCPFCGAEPSSSFTDMKAVIKCEPCGFAMEHSTVIVSLRVAEDVQRRVVTKRWNTRPAAPVEVIIAAEREAQQRLLDIIEEANTEIESSEVEKVRLENRILVLEADNAALTARVKELSEALERIAARSGIPMAGSFAAEVARAALEARP